MRVIFNRKESAYFLNHKKVVDMDSHCLETQPVFKVLFKILNIYWEIQEPVKPWIMQKLMFYEEQDQEPHR